MSLSSAFGGWWAFYFITYETVLPSFSHSMSSWGLGPSSKLQITYSKPQFGCAVCWMHRCLRGHVECPRKKSWCLLVPAGAVTCNIEFVVQSSWYLWDAQARQSSSFYWGEKEFLVSSSTPKEGWAQVGVWCLPCNKEVFLLFDCHPFFFWALVACIIGLHSYLQLYWNIIDIQ